MKSHERIKEGRIARLKAEIAKVTTNKPVSFMCVYKRPEQRQQYQMGWNSVNQVDIDAAVMRAKGETPVAHTKVSITLKKLKENLCSSF